MDRCYLGNLCKVQIPQLHTASSDAVGPWWKSVFLQASEEITMLMNLGHTLKYSALSHHYTVLWRGVQGAVIAQKGNLNWQGSSPRISAEHWGLSKTYLVRLGGMQVWWRGVGVGGILGRSKCRCKGIGAREKIMFSGPIDLSRWRAMGGWLRRCDKKMRLEKWVGTM